MNKSVPNFVSLLLLLIVVGIGYQYRADLKSTAFALKEIIIPIQPCERPITYSLGQFDSEFNISESDFLSILQRAESIWEEPLGKDLFVYIQTGGDVDVHLIYDNRQKATQELSQIDDVIQNKTAAYESAKAEYDALNKTYAQRKNTLEQQIAAYENRKNIHEKNVQFWNEKGGAPQKEYEQLEIERQALNDEVERINQAQASFNTFVSNLNSKADALNRLAQDLNINVKTYNTIGGSVGEEFNEGEYVQNADGKSIHIYQFENRNMLTRVLAHEFGHALGLDHIEEPEAIMYRLNSGTAPTATAGDISILRALCESK